MSLCLGCRTFLHGVGLRVIGFHYLCSRVHQKTNSLRQNYKRHHRNDNLLLNGQDWNDEAEYCDEPDDSTNSSSLEV